MAMNKPSFSFPLAFLLVLLLSISGGPLKLVNGEEVTTWCVAKPSTDETTLVENLNFACAQVDCSILLPGFPCYDPENDMSHASVAMNIFYQNSRRNASACDFTGTGLVTKTDPSYFTGSIECKYLDVLQGYI